MPTSEVDITVLAALARLELSSPHDVQLGAQLRAIVAYLGRLQTVDVEGVPDYQSPPAKDSALRADQVIEGSMLSRATFRRGVPKLCGDQVEVPKFKSR